MTTLDGGASRRYVVAGQSYTREELIHRNLHLVKYIAGRICVNVPRSVELGDLINDGVIGLIDAIEKFDDTRGVKFETYAITRIHGAILDALRSLDWVSRGIRQRARRVERVTLELESELARVASDEEVAERLGISSKDLAAARQRVAGATLVSLEDRVPSLGERFVPLRELLCSPEDGVGSGIERGELNAELDRAVQMLPGAERTVVAGYYFEGRTLKQIKEELNVSESRVSQIHAQAIGRLRKLLRHLKAELGYRNADASVPRRYARGRSARRSAAV
jgi:RNA polymerase sigma factor for flagellar operon FliA